MRLILLSHADKSVATLFQTFYVLHALREVHEELSFDIFDRRYNYLSFRPYPYKYWAITLLIWHSILSSQYLGGQCIGFVSFLS